VRGSTTAINAILRAARTIRGSGAIVAAVASEPAEATSKHDGLRGPPRPKRQPAPSQSTVGGSPGQPEQRGRLAKGVTLCQEAEDRPILRLEPRRGRDGP
jgi:hypothetical protein